MKKLLSVLLVVVFVSQFAFAQTQTNEQKLSDLQIADYVSNFVIMNSHIKWIEINKSNIINHIASNEDYFYQLSDIDLAYENVELVDYSNNFERLLYYNRETIGIESSVFESSSIVSPGTPHNIGSLEELTISNEDNFSREYLYRLSVLNNERSYLFIKSKNMYKDGVFVGRFMNIVNDLRSAFMGGSNIITLIHLPEKDLLFYTSIQFYIEAADRNGQDVVIEKNLYSVDTDDDKLNNINIGTITFRYDSQNFYRPSVDSINISSPEDIKTELEAKVTNR